MAVNIYISVCQKDKKFILHPNLCLWIIPCQKSITGDI